MFKREPPVGVLPLYYVRGLGVPAPVTHRPAAQLQQPVALPPLEDLDDALSELGCQIRLHASLLAPLFGGGRWWCGVQLTGESIAYLYVNVKGCMGKKITLVIRPWPTSSNVLARTGRGKAGRPSTPITKAVAIVSCHRSRTDGVGANGNQEEVCTTTSI